MKDVITIRNGSYIPFRFKDMLSLPDIVAGQVLESLAEFEQTHKKLEVVSYSVDMSDIGKHCPVAGIWVYHRPKRGKFK